ncbi:hypothetical protein quinque_011368 [Culex quinquefasciatus]
MTVLRSPSGSHDKHVDINYLGHIPQNRSIVRITSILNAYKVIVCFKDKNNVSPSCDTAQAQRSGLSATSAMEWQAKAEAERKQLEQEAEIERKKPAEEEVVLAAQRNRRVRHDKGIGTSSSVLRR